MNFDKTDENALKVFAQTLMTVLQPTEGIIVDIDGDKNKRVIVWKAIDETLAFAYWTEKKLPTRIVRFFNTVGPRQVGSYGMVIPRFVSMALKNEPITIYGNGEQTRCFGHIYDVIDAVMLVAFSDNTIGKAINIGNNFEISMNDLAKKIIKETRSKSEIIFIPYSEAYGDGFEDMERRVPNIDLIKSLTGWQPKRDLTQIIKDVAKDLRL
jgi:UDP-glucose 4-epimerase